jgi:hypothetical protein
MHSTSPTEDLLDHIEIRISAFTALRVSQSTPLCIQFKEWFKSWRSRQIRAIGASIRFIPHTFFNFQDPFSGFCN